MSDRDKILDAVAPLKRGKWVSAALRPWTGEVAAAKFEELRSAVEERGNQAIDEAAIAGYEAGKASVTISDIHGRERDSERERFENVLVNIHSIARNEPCEPGASIGLATTAVAQLRRERDHGIKTLCNAAGLSAPHEGPDGFDREISDRARIIEENFSILRRDLAEARQQLSQCEEERAIWRKGYADVFRERDQRIEQADRNVLVERDLAERSETLAIAANRRIVELEAAIQGMRCFHCRRYLSDTGVIVSPCRECDPVRTALSAPAQPAPIKGIEFCKHEIIAARCAWCAAPPSPAARVVVDPDHHVFVADPPPSPVMPSPAAREACGECGKGIEEENAYAQDGRVFHADCWRRRAVPSSHAHDCAIALNARHECSCGVTPPRVGDMSECLPNGYSSRMCQRGTKSCAVEHADAVISSNREDDERVAEAARQLLAHLIVWQTPDAGGQLDALCKALNAALVAAVVAREGK